MMRDVFYFGDKPNVHPKEKFARDLEDARCQATTEHFWIVHELCDYKNFDWDIDILDFPDSEQWAFDHDNVWPSQHQKDSGTWLCPKNKGQYIVYRNDVEPVKRRNIQTKHWKILEDIDKTKFDFSWHPDSTSPPYIYAWGCKYYPVEANAVVEYHVPDATDYKYMNDIVELLPKRDNWKILEDIDEASFDFNWRPDPREPAYIYAWGNQYNKPTVKTSVEYKVPGATQYKYMDVPVTRKPCLDNWEIPQDIDIENFDFSWEPDMRDPPYIYQFYTELDKLDGPKYVSPNNDGTVVYKLRVDKKLTVNKYYINTTLSDLVEQHKDEVFWACRKNIDYTDFDFTWLPDKIDLEYELDYVHVHGSKDSELTQTYFVSAKNYLAGKTDYKFVTDIKLDENSYGKIFAKPDIFYIDKNNIESEERYLWLKEKFNDRISKTRFANTTVDTISRCIKKSKTELFYVLDSELDYTDFDFDYYPNPWQMKMVHVFGTQHNTWGTTYLINKETFNDDTRHVKKIEHLSNINLVKKTKAKITNCSYDVLLVDHGNDEIHQVLETITRKVRGRAISIVKYQNSYLETLKSYLSNIITKKEHYLYVCSSLCDYSEFDFTYVSDPFAREQLHVFPSNNMKYGDTFLIDVNKCKVEFDNIAKLEDYDKINFNNSNRPTRLNEPVIYVDDDTHVDSLVDSSFPYVRYVSSDNRNIVVNDIESVNIWSQDTQQIVIQSVGATSILVPTIAKNMITKELYDYPHIKKVNILSKSKPLDIVFLSNGENIAKDNYDRLRELTSRYNNRVVHVEGINGRMNAYHAAAKASETPWMFTVFAKLEVDENFDWDWQPDRMQVPKHYIFHALNPVNKLVYGHQAMIAYNKRLVLNNTGRGLDFTLDDEHEVIPVLSGIARYNTDEFTTWRTSFREVIKLQCNTDNDSKNRLTVWLTEAQGDYAEYSLRGANDAVRYYQSVDGDFDQLKLSYEWDWLRERFRLTSNLI